jgi:hypothetical protein
VGKQKLCKKFLPRSRGPDKPTFTLFSNLAPELRYMIWREAFPKGREICLYSHPYTWEQPEPLALPVTLHVNRESRAITLEHYTILCHHLDERPAVITLPICFDLKRDSFSINIQSIANSNFNNGQSLGLPSSVIREIRTLKLISAWQNFPFHHNIRPPYRLFYDHTKTVPTVEHKALFFKGFSGLEEVHLVPGPKLFETRQVKGPLGPWWGGIPWSPVEEIITDEDQKKAIKTMKAYFMGVKSQTEDFNLPKIIVVEK